MIGVALLVSVFGMLADGTVQENMRLVRAEIAILVIVSIGFLLQFGPLVLPLGTFFQVSPHAVNPVATGDRGA